MVKLCFSFIFLWCGLLSIAQNYIQDLDNNPISGVHIYNASNLGESVITQMDGSYTFHSNWKNGDTLLLSHSLYEDTYIPYSKLKNTKIFHLTEDINFLEEIVVTVNNNEELLKQRAERRVIINKREIEKFNPQTSADLLANKPGISVQKSQSGGGSPNIRGNEANRILLMIDGVRMNNAIYRGGHLQNSITIDPSILAKSEILYGPSSVVYGSDALGGVVHFKTRIPDLTDETDLNYYSTFTTGNSSLITHVDLEYGKNKIAFLSSFTYKTFGESRMGNYRLHGYKDWGKINHYFDNGVMKKNDNPNLQKKSDYTQIDALQKIVFKPTSTSRLIGNFQYSTSSNINRLDQLNDYKGDLLKFEDWYYGPQNRVLASATYEDWKSNKLYDKADIVAAYQFLEESRHSKKTANDYRNNQIENVDVYSLNLNFTKGIFGYGYEGIYNDVKSTATLYYPNADSTVNSVITRYPTNLASMSSHATYVKSELSVNEKVKLNFGVRFTKTRLQADFNSSKNGLKLPNPYLDKHDLDANWNTSIVYHPEESWKIAGIVSTGFHAPNIDDITKFYEKGNNLVVPNLLLKSEYTTNFEINMSKHFNKKHLVNLDLYYNNIRNAIVKVDGFKATDGYSIPNPDGLNKQSNINVPKAYIYGSSFYMSSQWNKFWSTHFDLTYTFGKISEHSADYLDRSQVLAHIPPLFGKLGIEHKNKDFRQRFTVVFNSRKAPSTFDVAGVDNLDEGVYTLDEEGNEIAQGVPAWFTLNYSLQFDFSDQITLQGSFNNILDLHYRTYGSGVSALGRSLSVTLRARL